MDRFDFQLAMHLLRQHSLLSQGICRGATNFFHSQDGTTIYCILTRWSDSENWSISETSHRNLSLQLQYFKVEIIFQDATKISFHPGMWDHRVRGGFYTLEEYIKVNMAVPIQIIELPEERTLEHCAKIVATEMKLLTPTNKGVAKPISRKLSKPAGKPKLAKG